MRYIIEHETDLHFSTPVNEHQCEMRFTPRADESQLVHRLNLEVLPGTDFFNYVDAFGNRVHHFSILEPHDRLLTKVRIEVETRLNNPFDYALLTLERERTWYEEKFSLEPTLWQYVLHNSSQTPRWSTLNISGAPTWDRTRPVQDLCWKVMDWVSSFLTYRKGTTEAHTSLADVVQQKSGVCQDYAHLMISLIRSWGIPARYVMGYLSPNLSDIYSPQAQASHAWAEILIPNAGWRGFDPTHQLMANDSYIAVASGRDSHDAAPQRGSFKGMHSAKVPDIRLVVTQQNQ